MASEQISAKQAVKASHPPFGVGANGNGSIFTDKRGLRGSTPDSEALVSSEDELDQQIHAQVNPSGTGLPVKPHRRPSWLGDVQSGQRRGSFVGSSSFTSGSSHPNTPSADGSSWATGLASGSGAGLGRGHTTHGSFPWGSGIWNTEARKEPPSRLTEVLPSPTTIVPPGSSAFFGDNEPLASPPLVSERTGDSTIPFAIPLHPTPKTYRSQSYSVGQMESDFNGSNGNPGSYFSSRMRPSQQTGLQHRPSRPSMLSEVSNDGNMLGQLHEVDDDDESATESQQGVRISSPHAYEHHTPENPLLKQATSNQIENPRSRTRAATAIVAPSGSYTGKNGAQSSNIVSGNRHQDSVPEEDEYAVDGFHELNDVQGLANKGNLTRRFSEYSSPQDTRFSSFGPPENRQLESVKKGHWQSSLGFGGIAEGPQSRRHSFADVPTRNASISTIGEYPPALGGSDFGLGLTGRNEAATKYSGDSTHLTQGDVAYFASPPGHRAADILPGSAPPVSLHPRYTMQNQYMHPPSPPTSSHRAMFGMPQHYNLAQPRQNQLLYIVTFKCCRSDVFYIQEGTGLHVKPGDLVIVEADRGTDLGTVAHADVTWAEAKEWKEYYGHEHYRWLMVFSRQSGPAANASNGLPPNGLQSGMLASQSNGLSGSAIGGMGPPQPGHQGMQEQNPGEMRPKMIKRLAQNHEIQTLRDKEGNEAKAKRVCQQKVQEHHLQMEILDAEFQMDWKKLTFYYFADSYINFNSLVTDLFKVYKTRIWMSALNPASHANSSISIQPPSGIGPGALNVTRDPSLAHQQLDQSIPSGLGQYRNLPSVFGQPTSMADTSGRVDGPGRDSGIPLAPAVENNLFPYFNQPTRSSAGISSDYTQGTPQSSESFSPGYADPGYNNLNSRFDAYNDHSDQNGNSFRRQAASNQAQRDGWWIDSMQGLSLGSQ